MGRAVAEELATRGARVALLDFREDAALDALGALPGGAARHVAVTADVTSPEQVQQAVEAVVAAFGGVDLVCNAAGVPDDATPCHEMPVEQWHQVLSVDLTGPFLVTRAVLPSMLARGGGAIVNIASMAALVAGGGGVAYTAAKHGLLGLTKRLALEYGPRGIRVNAVCPGYIRTSMNEPWREALRDTVGATPAGRWAEPEEVARLIAYLLGDDAGYVMGAAVTIDGGTTVM